jgi:ubiquinone/menaquinone biosynthesis C-methylase UbiE
LEERYLTSILPDVSGSNVVDLGCGTGRWLTRLMELGAGSVVGIDISSAMLKVANQGARIRSRLVLADSLHLPFRASLFDFALSCFALNHICDLQAMARELSRTMKRNGRLLISEMHPDAYDQGWRPGFRDTRTAVQIETVSHSSESVTSCFGLNGFALVRSHDLFFAEPERLIFLRAGKESIFERACHVPAIRIYEFRKMEFANES